MNIQFWVISILHKSIATVASACPAASVRQALLYEGRRGLISVPRSIKAHFRTFRKCWQLWFAVNGKLVALSCTWAPLMDLLAQYWPNIKRVDGLMKTKEQFWRSDLVLVLATVRKGDSRARPAYRHIGKSDKHLKSEYL